MSGQSVKPDRICQSSLNQEHINPLSNKMKSQMKGKKIIMATDYTMLKKNRQKRCLFLCGPTVLQIVHTANSKIAILKSDTYCHNRLAKICN